MASVQEVVTAAYRIADAAKGVKDRMSASTGDMRNHHSRLVAVAQGSRSGEAAAQQVQGSIQALQDSIQRLQELESQVKTFVNDLTK